MEAKFKRIGKAYYVVGPASLVRPGAFLLIQRKKGDTCKVRIKGVGSVVEIGGQSMRAATFEHVR